MIKEIRLIVRLVALWILFIASLGFLYYSVQSLTISIVKTANGGYENYYASGSYGNYCLQYPVQPQCCQGESKEDKIAIDKYNKDLQKYNNDLEVKCMADLAKQEKSQENQVKSSSIGDITSYSILSFLSIVTVIISLLAIRKTEESQ